MDDMTMLSIATMIDSVFNIVHLLCYKLVLSYKLISAAKRENRVGNIYFSAGYICLIDTISV
jgi:hypothetical protein